MIGFFTGSVWGILTGILVSVILLAVIVSVTTAALMATGGPSPCVPATTVVVNQANSDAFQEKWDAFDARINSGASATVTFTESEIASRAESWANDESAPLSDMLVCLHDDEAEASAVLELLGMRAKFRISGTLDLSGDSPRAEIDDISVGNVPSFLMWPVERMVDNGLDEALRDLRIEHGYTLTLRENAATIDGVPRTPAAGAD